MIHYHIILPSYHYYKGTNKILEKIHMTNTKNLSLYIFDNTNNNKIYLLYLKFKKKLNITYFVNRPTVSAGTNWNQSLFFLKKTIKNQLYKKDQYFIMLHHDEHFNDKNFFIKLSKLIKNNFYPDVISMTVCVDYNNLFKNKIHTTSSQRSWLFKNYFDYILLRNYIGPVSSLVIRYKKNIPIFDIKLKWLIDVDFYKKLKNYKNWIFTDDLFLFSDQKNNVSLTLKYQFQIKKLYNKEIKLISRKYNLKSKFLDYIIWAFVRISNKLKYFINIKKYRND